MERRWRMFIAWFGDDKLKSACGRGRIVMERDSILTGAWLFHIPVCLVLVVWIVQSYIGFKTCEQTIITRPDRLGTMGAPCTWCDIDHKRMDLCLGMAHQESHAWSRPGQHEAHGWCGCTQ